MNMPRRSTVFSAFFETFTVSVYNWFRSTRLPFTELFAGRDLHR